MRIIKFTKLDLLKLKRNWILLLFPFISLVFIDSNQMLSVPVGAVAYAAFAGIVAATIPFEADKKEESGFIRNLPAKPGEGTLGRFFFGFIMMVWMLGVEMITFAIASPFMKGVEFFSPLALRIYACIFGAALVFSGIQTIVYSLFRAKNNHVQAFIRLAVPFLFFFCASTFMVNADLDSLKYTIEMFFAHGGALIVCAAGIVLHFIMGFVVSKTKMGKKY